MTVKALPDVAAIFSEQLLKSAMELAATGRVTQIEAKTQTRESVVIVSRVLEKHKAPYRVKISFDFSQPKDAFSSVCNCYAYSRCKHAAATLIALSFQKNHQSSIPPFIFDWLKGIKGLERGDALTLTELKYVLRFPPVVSEKLLLSVFYYEPDLETDKEFFLGDDSSNQALSILDEKILSFLSERQTSNGFNGAEFCYTLSQDGALYALIQSGRAYVENTKVPLSWGVEKTLKAKWHLNENGTQTFSVRTEDARDKVFLLNTLFYIASDNTLGSLSSPLSLDIVKTLLFSKPIPANRIRSVSQKLEPLIGREFLPNEVEISRVENSVLPTMRIEFISFELFEAYIERVSFQINGQVIGAKVYFCYGDTDILYLPSDKNDSFIRTENGLLIEVMRNFEHERQWLEKANAILMLKLATTLDGISMPLTQRSSHFIVTNDVMTTDRDTLLSDGISALTNLGIDTNTDKLNFYQVLDEELGHWSTEITSSGENFFELELGIQFEDRKIQVLPLVLSLLKQYELSELASLDDNFLLTLAIDKYKKIKVPLFRLKPVLKVLGEVIKKQMKEGEINLKLAKSQAALLHEMSEATRALQMRWLGHEELVQLGSQLKDFDKIEEVAIPDMFLATLRDYQKSGASWLQFLRRYSFSGILADEMGLGKTVQTLAHLSIEREAGRLVKPCLIIAPTSLMSNWAKECERFSPYFSYLIHHGDKRDKAVDLNSYDLVFTTYAIALRDKAFFLQYDFYYLILDEAQNIKNSAAKTTQSLLQFKAAHRLCLTGTPLENHLGELWSLFNFLMPGFLYEKTHFTKHYRLPIEKDNDEEAKSVLRSRIKPFLLRRIKKEVAMELPSKTESTIWVELSGKQRDVYESIRLSMQDKVRNALAVQGLGKSHIIILDALLRLRQTCCSPKLLKMEGAQDGNSEKVSVLFEMLPTLIEEGRKILLFSQFTSMISILEKEMTARNISFVTLTGKTKDRQGVIDDFSKTDIPVFLISLKAGGTGLNLTQADTVIHFDPWWNPQVEDQATDRSHRIGQTKPVFVYRLVCKNTVEEVMQTLKLKKSALVDNLLSFNQGNKLSLTSDDVKALFDTPLS